MPRTAEFDCAEALQLARYSEASYDLETLEAQALEPVEVYDKGTAVLFMYGMRPCIAIQGTNNIREWVGNARFLPTRYPPFEGMAHRGFVGHFSGLWHWVRSQLLSPKVQTAGNVIFTGHSLGGIAAIYAAQFTSLAGYKKVDPCYVFGAPRGGNSKFVKSFQPTVFDVVNDLDLVTHFPTACFYRRVGTRVTLNNQGVHRIGDSWVRRTYELVRRSDFGQNVLGVVAEGCADHSISDYRVLLQRELAPKPVAA